MDCKYLTEQCKTCSRWGQWKHIVITSAGRTRITFVGCQYNFPSDYCEHARKTMEKTESGENVIVSPEEFAAQMKEFSFLADEEERHACMDELMCHVLIGLGYADGVEIFNATPTRYA